MLPTEPAKRPPTALQTISSNAIWSLLRYGGSWLILLVVPPFLIHQMNNAAYGTWMLLLQFGSYVSLFESNMQTAIARYVGHATGTGDRTYLAKVLGSVLPLLIICSVLATLLTSLASWKFTSLFPKIPVALHTQAQVGIWVIGISLALALPFTTLVGGFLGLQRYRVVTVAVIAAKIVSGIGMVWAASRHQTIVALACWFCVGTLVPPVFYVMEWLRFREELPISPRAANLSFIREFAGFYTMLAIAGLSSIFITGLDIPIVATYDFQAVGLYSLAAIFGNMLLIPQGSIVNTVMPSAAGLSASRDAAMVGRALNKFIRYASASMCVIAVGLALGAPLLLNLWIGTALAGKVLPLALTLLLAQFVMLTAHPYKVFAMGAGQQAQAVPAQLIEGVVNVICSFALARYWGALGVAVGTLLGSCAGLIAHFTVTMPHIRQIELSRRSYARISLLDPMLACLPAMALLVILWSLHWNSVASAILAAVGVLATIRLLWSRTFTLEERQELTKTLRWKLRLS